MTSCLPRSFTTADATRFLGILALLVICTSVVGCEHGMDPAEIGDDLALEPGRIESELLVPQGGPNELTRHSAVWDAANSRMIVFGGLVSGSHRNDTWIQTWNGNALNWSVLSATGTPPSPRYGHSAVWDAANSRMIVFGGGFNSTWVLAWDGTSWTWNYLYPTGTPPSRRSGHSAVWDVANSRMIVFGGSDGSIRNDTWVLAWDGTSWAWSELSPTGTPPSVRSGHSAVWDAASSRMIVFGGGGGGSTKNDTWALAWDGTSWAWSELSPTGTPPSVRSGHSAVWDAANSRMIVFGAAGIPEKNDSWALAWDGTSWAWDQLFPTGTLPTARSGHSAVWDAANSRMIVFGGTDSIRMNNNWVLEWDGTSWAWNQVYPTGTPPSTRYRHSAVWDWVNSRMIVFGGMGLGGYRRNDTWTLIWGGTSWMWSEVSPTGSLPLARYSDSAVWDAANDRMIVFGGYDGSRMNDAWILTWDGATWTWNQLFQAGPAPSARYLHSAVWDAANSRMIVFGGSDGSITNETWTLSWNGALWSWSLLSPTGTPPSARALHSSVWDAANNRMIVFGGSDGTLRNDTWTLTWDGTSWSWDQLFPTGTSPSARSRHSSVWDAANNRMIVFGGWVTSRRNDTWTLTWDGTSWTWNLLSPTGTPPLARHDHSAVWDAAHDRMIVFGGYDTSPKNDTWALTWDGTSWTWNPIVPVCEDEPPVPVLDQPDEGATVQTCSPTLAWTVPGTVTGYDFMVFVNGSHVGTTGSTQFAVPPRTPLGDSNTWLVKAVGCLGIQEVSATGSFGLDASSISPPEAPVLVTQPDFQCDLAGAGTFSWSGDGDLAYDLILNGERVQTGLTQTYVTLPASFGYQQVNTWQVAARNCAHETLSAIGTFSVTSLTIPQTPTITAPAHGSTVYCDPTITWTYPTATTGIVFDIIATTDQVVLASGIQCTASPCSWVPGGNHRLANGSYTYRVLARNCAGETVQSAARAFTVDNTPIAPVLSIPSEGQVTNGTPTFAWTITGTQQPDVRYSIYMDGDAVPLASGISGTSHVVPQDSPILEGAHNWQVVAYGCLDTPAQSGWRAVVVDRTGPEAFDTLHPENGAWLGTVTSLTMSWTPATDQPAGVAGYHVFLNDQRVCDVDQAISSCTVDPGAEGQKTWRVDAVDAVGNVTSTSDRIFGIDRSPPEPFDLLSPGDGVMTTEGRPEFSWGPTSDSLSGVSHFELFINGSRTGDDIPVGALSAQPVSDLGDGTHQWHVVAVDRAGNRTTSTQTRTIFVDGTAPMYATLLGVTPQGTGDWVPSSIPTFRFTAADSPGGSGIDHFLLFIDGEQDLGGPVPVGSGACAPDTCRDSFDPLDDGEHSWYVVAFDRVGLFTRSATGTFKVETRPPLPFSHISPANGATVTTFHPLLCWDRTTDVVSGVMEYRVNIRRAGAADVNLTVPQDGGTGQACVRPDNPLTGGSYTWLVTALDHAGNMRDANAGVRWTMTIEQDVIPPTSSVTQPASDGDLWGCRILEFKGTAWDPGSSPTDPTGSGVVEVEVQLDGTSAGGWQKADLGGSVSDSVRHWTWSSNVGTTGMHTLFVRAMDAEGNVQVTPKARSFEVDCTGPLEFDLKSPANEAYVGTCASFSWEATTDSPGGMGYYELRIQGSGGGDPLVINTGIDTSHTLAGEECRTGSAYRWHVKAYDTLGNSTDSSQTYSLFVDVVPPSTVGITAPPEGLWLATARPVIAWIASIDDHAGVCGYRVRVDGIESEVDKDVLSHLPGHDLADGLHQAGVVAVDCAGNASAMATREFRTDVTPPDAVRLDEPEDEACVGAARPVFKWVACADATSGIAEATVHVDATVVARVANQATTHAASEVDLAEGPRTWRVTCTDLAGNPASSDERVVHVDRTKPTVSIAKVDAAAGGLAVSGTAGDTSPCGVAWVEVRLNQGGYVQADLDFVTGEWTWDFEDVTEGNHSLWARSGDVAGNVSVEYQVTVGTGVCWITGDCDPDTRACSLPDDGAACDEQDPLKQCVNGMCVRTGCLCEGQTACCDGCMPMNQDGECDDGDPCTDDDKCDGHGLCIGTAVCEDDAVQTERSETTADVLVPDDGPTQDAEGASEVATVGDPDSRDNGGFRVGGGCHASGIVEGMASIPVLVSLFLLAWLAIGSLRRKVPREAGPNPPGR